jgi:hypothetical protein
MANLQISKSCKNCLVTTFYGECSVLSPKIKTSKNPNKKKPIDVLPKQKTFNFLNFRFHKFPQVLAHFIQL